MILLFFINQENSHRASRSIQQCNLVFSILRFSSTVSKVNVTKKKSAYFLACSLLDKDSEAYRLSNLLMGTLSICLLHLTGWRVYIPNDLCDVDWYWALPGGGVQRRSTGLFSQLFLGFNGSCVLEALGAGFICWWVSGPKDYKFCYRLNPGPTVFLKHPGWIHCSDV